MNDLIRSGIYTGLGSLVIARKKLEELMEELIQNNEFTQDEGRRIVQDFIRKAEDIRDESGKMLLNTIDDILLRAKLPARHEIETRMQDLIDKLNEFRRASLFPSGSGSRTNKPAAH